MFRMVDHAREMNSGEMCKYGEYGSLEHLLFVLFQTFFCHMPPSALLCLLVA